MMVRRFAAIASLVLLAFGGGCIQTENSNSMDDLIYGAAGGSPGFGTVRFILYQSCANCHNYHTMSEDQMKAEGILVGGSPTSSSIYHRLKGALGGAGPKNMPPNGALTQADIADIEDWINGVPP